jgi:hypothetical protein
VPGRARGLNWGGPWPAPETQTGNGDAAGGGRATGEVRNQQPVGGSVQRSARREKGRRRERAGVYSIVRFGGRAQVRLGPADALAQYGPVKRSFMSTNRHGKKSTVAASARRHHHGPSR